MRETISIDDFRMSPSAYGKYTESMIIYPEIDSVFTEYGNKFL